MKLKVVGCQPEALTEKLPSDATAGPPRLRLASTAIPMTRTAATPATGSSRIQLNPPGVVGGAIPGAAGVGAWAGPVTPPAVNAGAPSSATISGIRHCGQTVSPF